MTKLLSLAMVAFITGTTPLLAQGIILVSDIPMLPAMDGMVGQALYHQNGTSIGKIEDIVAGSDGVSLFVMVRGDEHRQLVSLDDINCESGHMTLKPAAGAGGFIFFNATPNPRPGLPDIAAD